jgi:hypothetical protein
MAGSASVASKSRASLAVVVVVYRSPPPRPRAYMGEKTNTRLKVSSHTSFPVCIFCPDSHSVVVVVLVVVVVVVVVVVSMSVVVVVVVVVAVVVDVGVWLRRVMELGGLASASQCRAIAENGLGLASIC